MHLKHSKTSNSKYLWCIVIAQFCCTSVWLGSNAVLSDIIEALAYPDDSRAALSAAVQIGFVIGTIGFASIQLAERFSAKWVFFTCAIVSSILCSSISFLEIPYELYLISRVLQGICLAGIYPVGMALATQFAQVTLGKWLGVLVAALALGTSTPYWIQSLSFQLEWKWVLGILSCLSVFGACLIAYLPNIQAAFTERKFNPFALFKAFQNAQFKQAALGYFAHMWELYIIWVFTPVILLAYTTQYSIEIPNAFWSACIVSLGAIGCILSGFLSGRFKHLQIAKSALIVSSLCCVCLIWIFQFEFISVFIGVLLLYGFSVIADSPMFSTLVANNAPVDSKASTLSLINGIGFGISAVSLLCFDYVYTTFSIEIALFVSLLPNIAYGIYCWFRKNSEIAIQ